MKTHPAFKMLARAALVGAAFALTCPLTACKDEAPAAPAQQEVTLNVTTVDLQGKPVEAVRFYINGKKFGITDQEGKFVGRYPAKNGETLMFNVEAPTGYSVPASLDQSRWQVQIQYPEDGRPLQIDFPAQLQRPENEYLLIVRADQPGTPVKLNEALVGTAGANGDVLVKVKGVPGTAFVASAGSVSYKGTFAEDVEAYVLSARRVGPVAEGAPGAAPPPPAEPATVAEVVAAAAPVAAEAPTAEDPPFPTGRTAAAVQAPPAAYAAREPEPEPRDEAPEPVAVRPAPRPTETQDLLLDEPEPQPQRVAAAPARQRDEPAIDDLLGDAPTPAPAPVAQRRAPPVEAPGGLMADGGDTVDPKTAGRAAVAVVGGGASPATMSREEIDARLSQIQGNLSASRVLTKADVDFLGQIDRTHPGYFEAHRLLADYHSKNKDYRRQAEELEVATSSGKYKRDPTLLLSLAKAYGKQQNYGRALSSMQRVEENMRNLPANQKSDAYRFYAEMYEFEFMRQHNDDPKKANAMLLDKAITQWERYATFSRGADPAGVAHAESKLKKLGELKNGLEL